MSNQLIKGLMASAITSTNRKAGLSQLKKNNENQDKLLDGILSQVDNQYISKTEQGTVIHLENSGDGIVKLGDIYGQSLVNYCTNGSLEYTASNEINDLRGTNITLTTGADNSIVDVECEGETLVNLATIKSEFRHETSLYYMDGTLCETSTLKLNTPYTFLIEKEYLEGHNNNYNSFELGVSNQMNGTEEHPTCTLVNSTSAFNNNKKEFKIITVTFSNFKNYKYLSVRPCRRYTPPVQGEKANYLIKIVMLESDIDTEIPYFTGMKSVGEIADGDHGVEIISKGTSENIFLNTNQSINTGNIRFDLNPKYSIKDFTEGRTITISCDVDVENMGNVESRSRIGTEFNIQFLNDNGEVDFRYFGAWWSFDQGTTKRGRIKSVYKLPKLDNVISINQLGIYVQCSGDKHIVSNPKVEFDDDAAIWSPSFTEDTDFRYHNKKQVLFNEPLRSLPNGVKDKFVKKDGKWYIERNCNQVKIVESDLVDKTWGDDKHKRYVYIASALPNIKTNTMVISNKIPYTPDFSKSNYFGISTTTVLIFCFPTEQPDIDTKKEFVRQYLQDGGLDVIYQIETPIYEPLLTEPIVKTYNDETYISNDSFIPCTMTVKDSKPYNCIIKPNTKYTVLFDRSIKTTSLFRCILGGGTSPTIDKAGDGKLIVTTPPTLIDNQLTFIGKGNKVKNVRVIEGDIAYNTFQFEGLKSSFEDKIENNKYVFSLKNTNKNILKNTDFKNNENWNVLKGKIVEGYNGNKGVEYSNTDASGYVDFLEQSLLGVFSKFKKIKEDTWYTLSFYAKGTGQVCTYIYPSTINTTIPGMIDGIEEKLWEDGMKKWNLNNTWTKHTYTFKTKSDIHQTSYAQQALFRVFAGNSAIISCPMIEASQVATEYTSQNTNEIKAYINEPLRSVSGVQDKLCVINGKLMIERNCKQITMDGTERWDHSSKADWAQNDEVQGFYSYTNIECLDKPVICDKLPSLQYSTGIRTECVTHGTKWGWVGVFLKDETLGIVNGDTIATEEKKLKAWMTNNNLTYVLPLLTPTYEEVTNEYGTPIILEGYENGTIYIDSIIPPTTEVKYSPKLSARLSLAKIDDSNTYLTGDIQDVVLPHVMDLDYQLLNLESKYGTIRSIFSSNNLEKHNLDVEEAIDIMTAQERTFELLKRDIKSKRLTYDQVVQRVTAYADANRITAEHEAELLLLAAEELKISK